MDTLDLNIKQRMGVKFDLHPVQHELGKALLIGAARLDQPVAEGAVMRQFSGIFQQADVVHHTLAAGLAQQRGQGRIGLKQPAPKGYAIGFIGDPAWIKRMEIAEHGFAHQVCVQSGHTIDLMRA